MRGQIIGNRIPASNEIQMHRKQNKRIKLYWSHTPSSQPSQGCCLAQLTLWLYNMRTTLNTNKPRQNNIFIVNHEHISLQSNVKYSFRGFDVHYEMRQTDRLT